LDVLSHIAQSAYKMANDIRLLQSLKEIEEPFEKSQIGSSAMAYKRNPMRSERICSLARFVITLPLNTAITASTQWMERTLDDSANRRLVIPQGFLAADAILDICINVCNGLVVYDKVIQRHIDEELPFMATETILMEAVKRGGDRQQLHERIRSYSMEAAKQVKQGGANTLLSMMAKDEAFRMTPQEMEHLLNPSNFTGRAAHQVEEFIDGYVVPALEPYRSELNRDVDLKV